MPPLSRRQFVKHSLAAGVTLSLPAARPHASANTAGYHDLTGRTASQRLQLDLTPARWVWLPSKRCLANTVILFRKRLVLKSKPVKATGWILGESRYKLFLNGERIQFGPAPSDPRWAEADPVNFSDRLMEGENVIGAQVLYYGHGDGTWPIGKPGFICKLTFAYGDGTTEDVVTDESWLCTVARSWKPGQFKRWYLRSLQEDFDARLYPHGWTQSEFDDRSWWQAEALHGAADKPVISAAYRDYLFDAQGVPDKAQLRQRSITMPKESWVEAKKLTESRWLRWKRDPAEYFEFVTPDAFDVVDESLAAPLSQKQWSVLLNEGQAALLTFEFQEQIVGFPGFSIDAPAGTVIELLVHEAHEPGTDALINTHFHSWTRFVCKEGFNQFETFDYESLRWMQLHIRGASGKMMLSGIGVRRRKFDWQHAPSVTCSDPAVQQVIDASINTLYNCAIETIVDGMGRERQQYSGDVGHVLHAVFHTMGEPSMAARFINTYSQGITNAGYFLDCWPAFDRLARLMEREMQLTEWGPLLDHGIGFNFDVYHYYLYTGEVDRISEVFPRLVRFYHYLLGIRGSDGLLPVENIGVPVVWIDHNAYQKQRHKQCAFNLYAAAMMRHAFAPVCDAFGESTLSRTVRQEADRLLQATVNRFWSTEKRTFVNNLPWLQEEKEPRLCDRSLATALLYDQCPGGATGPSLELLVRPTASVGMSYPANTCWRYWALTRFNRADIFVQELKEKWSKLEAVRLNNTLAEDWYAKPDSNSQWSHCPIVPLYGMHMAVAGITPETPGFGSVTIAPQPGSLASFDITSHTVKGPIRVKLTKRRKSTLAEVSIPDNMGATFVWSDRKYSLKAGTNRLELAPRG